MKTRALGITLGAISFILLLASVPLISSWVAAQVTQASREIPCTSCGQNTLKSPNIEVKNVTLLEGKEKNKVLAESLSSQDYKNVKQSFIERGYTPQIENATAHIAKLLLNGTDTELLLVMAPFKGITGFSAGIIFIALENQTVAIGGIYNEENKKTDLIVASVNSQFLGEIILPSKCCGVVSPNQFGTEDILYDFCTEDEYCVEYYGPGYCCIDYDCVECDCSDNWDCEEEYGAGMCCVDHVCEPCEEMSCYTCTVLCGWVISVVCTIGVTVFCCLCCGCNAWCIAVFDFICNQAAHGCTWICEQLGYCP